MLSARQLFLMRLARDRAIDIAIAPLGTVVLLPDPDLRGRVFRCVSHVEAHVCRSIGWQDIELPENSQRPRFCWRMILSDLASPAEASSHMRNLIRGYAQAGNRFPSRITSGTGFFGIMR